MSICWLVCVPSVLYQVYLVNSVCYLYVHMSQNELFNFPKWWPEMITFFNTSSAQKQQHKLFIDK